MRIVLLALAIMALAFAGRAQTADEVAVLATNAAFDQAVVSRDADAYARILADEFIFTSADGTVSNKKTEVERMRSGQIKLESGKSEDIRVRVYGETAVVTGRFTAKGKNNGRDFTFVERYTALFVKRDGRWQIVAEHVSEIKPPK